jgi:sulfate transport system ATP-binding protein
MSITIQSTSKRFGSFSALDNVDLTIHSGELVALLGPSGCGKTTLLRIIAGLEFADAGQILFSGQDATHLQARERQVGFVFQHYALFRHMSVFENVAFGLRVMPRATRPNEAFIKKKVHELLSLVQLDWLADRFPAQLSGGQRQRIALARALAVEPKVLLLDEPFGALDAKVRKELRRWLRRLHDELHVTSVFVTHDQEEALEVADRVVVMNGGKIEQVGTPQEVWDRPASAFVMGFLGEVNRFPAPLQEGFATGPAVQPLSEKATAFVRPGDLQIERYSPGAPGIAVQLDRALVSGPVARLELSVVEGQATLGLPIGHVIEAHMEAARLKRMGLRPGELLVVTASDARMFADAA